MRQDSRDHNRASLGNTDERVINEDRSETPPNRVAMKLTPWKDIWHLLKIAKHRGDGEMVEVFYETLFKDAIFDDNGAWSWDINKRN